MGGVRNLPKAGITSTGKEIFFREILQKLASIQVPNGNYSLINIHNRKLWLFVCGCAVY